ncbi:Alpha/Beta hydrolase protein [Lasiosphaeria miniovina]|uniref:Alpha/Beta hydrolase protein n=1 Tax=Lasiosphaeria miniovina TaxID=1954250 RepID=A0AA40DNT6_9PEZI|nr:Alpha/Beta hydrolase protein [Lasiosphaeria miniovina]KAK0710075.1 Alpha/Beta hydrolase protein [Lasiosphaeria miniovina]
MDGFGVVPLGIPGTPAPFTLHVPQPELNKLSVLIETAVVAAPSFYNTHSASDNPDHTFGAPRDWLANATGVWAGDFDWRAREAHWNTIPQFKMDVTAPSDGQVFDLHFAALFSRRADAVPVILSHGWPSSWFDCVAILELLAAKYTPDTLPYHVVAPSIPDYGLSTRSNATTTELNFYSAAEALNELMKGLGFNAYVAQGGDVGSGLTAALGAVHDECKAVHFNNFILTPSEKAAVANLPVSPAENATLVSAQEFTDSGTGYMLEQGTRPGLISLVLMSNPVAMLEWIGSMYTDGVNGAPLATILEQVSWYWHTKSYGSGLWAYRAVWAPFLRDTHSERLPSPLAIKAKPIGYSWYPREVLAAAQSWVEHWFPDNLVFFKAHEAGGHLAALEQPVAFLQDLEDFVAIVKTKIEL